MLRVWMCKLCKFVCLWVCLCYVYVCTWLICCLCVMPVTGAITLSSRPLPAGEAVPRGREAPAGGRGREKYPSKLEWWYRHAKPLNTLSPRFSLCLRYQPRRWEDTRRASLTPRANKCEFPQRLSDGSSLSILWKSLISVVTFAELSKRRGTRAALWKTHWFFSVSGLRLSPRSRWCWPVAVWANNVTRWSILFIWKRFGSGKAGPPKTNVALLVFRGCIHSREGEIRGSKWRKSPKSPSDHRLCY